MRKQRWGIVRESSRKATLGGTKWRRKSTTKTPHMMKAKARRRLKRKVTGR